MQNHISLIQTTFQTFHCTIKHTLNYLLFIGNSKEEWDIIREYKFKSTTTANQKLLRNQKHEQLRQTIKEQHSRSVKSMEG